MAGLLPVAMYLRAACLLVSVVISTSCDEKNEVTVTETRKVTTADEVPKLFATSDERFRDAQPSPVKADTPEGWLVRPSSQFRLLNYRFGETGMGEVWVSLSSGSVVDNANRWLKQFGKSPLDPAAFANLASVSLAGSPGVWLTAEGDYGGIGADGKPGFALAGVIASIKGQILTVKMVGPKVEVEAARPALEMYIKSLQMVD
jgi:hypothetical protein